MIDVAKIDYWAANGSSSLHRATAPAKLFFLFCIVAAAVTAKEPFPLALGYAVLVLITAVSGLPWFAIATLSLYAAIFAVLYVVSLHGGFRVFSFIILKSILPAYAAGMLMVTTPYPRIFSFLSAFLPELLAAGLFMTYRTFFILLDMMENFGATIRFRGGFSPGSLYKNGANLARGIAMLLLRAVDRSSRLYAVMAVRGYSGSMADGTRGGLNKNDWLPIGTGISILTLSVLWK